MNTITSNQDIKEAKCMELTELDYKFIAIYLIDKWLGKQSVDELSV